MPSREITHRRAVFFLIAAAVLWSTGGLFVKSVAWNPVAIASVRSGVAMLFLGLVFKSRLTLPRTRAFPLSVLGYSGMLLCFVIGNKFTTAANVIFLQYLAPLYVVLLSNWILKEQVSRRDVLFMILALLGMVLVFSDQLSPTGILGNLYGIGSGICFAIMVLSMRADGGKHGLQTAFFGNACVLAVGLIFIRPPWPDVLDWTQLLYLGVIQIGIPYAFYAAAMKRMTALEGTMIPLLEPVLSPIWVALVIGEIPGIRGVSGMAIVLTALFFFNLSRAGKNQLRMT